ncbi:MAG: FkbM family methyltransferase [Cyanobacteria bacterium P01_G01_bin.49]
MSLPNGLTISALNEIEAKVLYCEIFSQRSYLKHGIQVSDGDCIFDIGANIGLYTIFLANSFSRLKIFAFEPIPDIFSILQENARNHLATSDIKLFNVGLSDNNKIAQFEFNPMLSFTATMYPQELADCVQQEASVYDWAKAIILDLPKISLISSGLAQFLIKVLSIPLLRALGLVILNQLTSRNLEKIPPKQVDCPMKTISAIVRENKITAIDVLKIDAEGRELDIVMGIEADDWRKIKQLIVEVHDINGRLLKMISLFESYGYNTLVDQEDWEVHKLMNIFTIYAAKRE